MSKRLFRIDGSRWGGEFVVGKVTEEFVDYWYDREDELCEHVWGLEFGDDEEGVDPDSPPIIEDMENYNAWYELDDFEHNSNCIIGDEFTVTEVTGKTPDDMEAWEYSEDHVEFLPNHLYSREIYFEAKDDVPEKERIPAIIFHSSEKGSFGSWFVETNGEDFDPSKVAVVVMETEMGEFIEELYYDKQSIECNYDYCDSRGKGTFAKVGYMNKSYYDSQDKITEKFLKEAWKDYDYQQET